ncbi:zinc finger BED domain-containing protein 5-like [Ornithodoros turicata]|uniref:zinc finger BED domain-containing protein 5-like n=1 Tax=Ornithodoros turicata TaxID=34597 RepID=UPI0031388956
MIHRQALASKTLPASLQEVLDQTIQIVNFVKGGALNTRLFKDLGNVTARLFELREELKVFFQEQGKTTYFAWLNEEAWILRLAYFVDMFEQLNKLNLQIQGRNTNIIKFIDSLKAFLCKVQNWKRKVNGGNVAMFEKLSSTLCGSYHDGKIPVFARIEILFHLTALQGEFHRYFPELRDDDLALVRNPSKLPVVKVPDNCQDEFLELQTDSAAKDIFEGKPITEFWPLMCCSYPKVSEKALRTLLPFVSTYLCESGFSALLQIKSKQRSRLDVESHLRSTLSCTAPRIEELLKNKQSQLSH